MRRLRQLALENIEKAQLLQKERYDGARLAGRPYEIGSRVYVAAVLAGRHTKLDDHWEGPFEILGFSHPGACEVVSLFDPTDQRVVAQDRLKPCYRRRMEVEPPGSPAVAVPLDGGSDSEYEDCLNQSLDTEQSQPSEGLAPCLQE